MKRIRPSPPRSRSPSLEELQISPRRKASFVHRSLSPSKQSSNANRNGKHPPTENGELTLNGDASVTSTSGSTSTDQQEDSMENRSLPPITEKVAILDFGAQYGKLIDRRVRECQVYSELLPLSTPLSELIEKGYKAVIISGGPNSVYAHDAPHFDTNLFFAENALPVLGICYGFQLINKAFKGSVAREATREDGVSTVEINPGCPLFDGLEKQQEVLLTHGDSVTYASVARELEVVAQTGNFVAGVSCKARKIFGVQFHPEVDLTVNGEKMIENFLRKVVGFAGKYTIESRELACINHIRKLVGEKNVLVMVSGGVDSTVCAALLHKALGPTRVHAIHIDNGFMRLNESDNVEKSLNELGLSVERFNFVDEFLNSTMPAGDGGEAILPLRLVLNPEGKRMIIGDTFIRCKDIALNKLQLESDIFFAQGTLRPDLIESASELVSGCAEVIKTHHNDTALVRKLRNMGKVVEPLSDFHKDEVRELGRALGLPESIVNRHPFPGPGLAIRILCVEAPYRCEDFDKAEELVRSIVHQASSGHLRCDLLPIRSVGVQGDRRSYSYVAAISGDYPSAYLPPTTSKWLELDKLAKLLTNRVFPVNRVVYVMGEKLADPVDDITVTHINETTLKQLQKADSIVYEVLCGTDESGVKDPKRVIISHIQQMPVVLVPVHFDRKSEPPKHFPSTCRSICLRPFITRDFMTGRAAVVGKDLPEESIMMMERRIRSEVPLISRVMLDLTSKPPGTTEWE